MRNQTVVLFRTSLLFLTAACILAADPAAQPASPAKAPDPRCGPLMAPPPRIGEVKLLPGLGQHQHPVSTTNRPAQDFFNQGIRLIYAFNHDEAERSFRKAAELDDNLAMAHWGIAFTLGANINFPAIPERQRRAYEAIQLALARLEHASERERGYIHALAKRYPANADAAPEVVLEYARAYADAMRELARRHPDDLDAQTLFADAMMNLRPWKLWTPEGRPAEGTEELVAALAGVLKRDPDHPGANHLFIHAVEASPNPELALPSAVRLATIAPNAGHLVHMPSHIYARVGDYSAATRANEAAASVDAAYLRETGATGWYPAIYYTHNLHFIAYAEGMSGRFETARAAARKVTGNIRPHLAQFGMLEGFLAIEPSTLLRFGRWDEVLALPLPDTNAPASRAFGHFARALAHAGKRQQEAAREEQGRFAAAVTNVPADRTFGLTPAAVVFKLAGTVLEARLADAAGDSSKAIELFRAAVETEHELAYDEPPSFYYPVRESLGAALLRAGQASEAERVFREELARNPRSGRALFGLEQSLLVQGKPDSAAWVRREFQSAWQQADVKLTLADL